MQTILIFVQDVLSAVGAPSRINPVLNGVIAGFNRRRRHQRCKLGHYNLKLDRLRYAETASLLDDNQAVKDAKSKSDKEESSKTNGKKLASEPCWFFQREVGCRRRKCPYTHKCVICEKTSH